MALSGLLAWFMVAVALCTEVRADVCDECVCLARQGATFVVDCSGQGDLRYTHVQLTCGAALSQGPADIPVTTQQL